MCLLARENRAGEHRWGCGGWEGRVGKMGRGALSGRVGGDWGGCTFRLDGSRSIGCMHGHLLGQTQMVGLDCSSSAAPQVNHHSLSLLTPLALLFNARGGGAAGQGGFG